MKKVLKILLIIVLAVVIVAGLGVGALTALEYRPAPAEEAPILAAHPEERENGSFHCLPPL